MKKTLFFTLMLPILISCGQSEYTDHNCFREPQEQDQSGINSFVSLTEFKKLMDREGVQLIDVRSPAEYRTARIEGARNINFQSPDFRKEIETLDKEKPVLLYCRTDRRSGKAAEELEEMGFKEIYVLKGGYLAWEE